MLNWNHGFIYSTILLWVWDIEATFDYYYSSETTQFHIISQSMESIVPTWELEINVVYLITCSYDSPTFLYFHSNFYFS